MPSVRSATKSPVALGREALAVAERALPQYSSVRSRHDFTLPQLFGILVLRQFFRTDYRGMVQLLQDLPRLRETLHLKKVPHFTTLQKAQQRLEKRGLSNPCSTLYSSGDARAVWSSAARLPWMPLALRAATSAAIFSDAAAV
jgi:hypothetical protein